LSGQRTDKRAGTGGTNPVEKFVQALRGMGKKVKAKDKKGAYEAECPAHEDDRASLSISTGDDGKVLLRCFAGCRFNAIVDAAGLTPSDCFPGDRPATDSKPSNHGDNNGKPKDVEISRTPPQHVAEFIYRGENREPLYKVDRFEFTVTYRRPDGSTYQKRKKDFYQSRPVPDGWVNKIDGVRRVLFMLPELLANPTQTVYLPEGEKKVIALTELGQVATTTSGGANNWHMADQRTIREALAGRHVIILPDNDEAGRKYGNDALRDLLPIVASVKVLNLPDLPPKGDIVDWLADDHTVAELEQLAADSPVVTKAPPDDGKERSSPSQPSDPPAEPALIVIRASKMKAKPVRYLAPGRFAFGKLHLIGGRGGSGKSTMLRKFVADLTRGRKAFGLSYDAPAPVDVLLVCGEDGPEDTIVPGLAAEDADLNRVGIIRGIMVGNKKQGFTLSAENIELIRRELANKPSIKVIIIDPIASYVGKLRVDDNRAAELRAAVLDPLNELAEEAGIAIILVAHLNKGNGDALDRIAGSAAYRDAVRAAYLVAPDEDDDEKRVIVPIKWNLPGFERTGIPFRQRDLTDGEAAAVLTLAPFTDLNPADQKLIQSQMRRVEFEAAENVNANELMGTKGGNDKNKVERCAEWLTGFLKDFAYPSTEIVDAGKAAGFTFDNVKKAKVILKERIGLQSSNLDRLQGIWWSGIGHRNDWRLRPEPPTNAHQSPHSHHTPLSPLSHHFGNTPGNSQCGETGETGEREEGGELFGRTNIDPLR
jgi:hypothetical protein